MKICKYLWKWVNFANNCNWDKDAERGDTVVSVNKQPKLAHQDARLTDSSNMRRELPEMFKGMVVMAAELELQHKYNFHCELLLSSHNSNWIFSSMHIEA